MHDSHVRVWEWWSECIVGGGHVAKPHHPKNCTSEFRTPGMSNDVACDVGAMCGVHGEVMQMMHNGLATGVGGVEIR